MSFPLGEAALSSIAQALADGESLLRAVEPYLRAMPAEAGGTVIDESREAHRDDIAAALRFLAEFTPAGGRSTVILGEFDADPADALEEHDYIGRLIVRLNIDQLIAVGHGARHIQAAAGLEGSWDGESLIVDNAAEAYDLLRGNIRENDVVLVKASPRAGLSSLVGLLTGVAQ